MKSELEIAKERIKELEALVKKLRTENNNCRHVQGSSKQMDDYEFNMHMGWKDEPRVDNVEYGGTIRHFRD